MEAYYCKGCKYYTDRLYNFKDHLISKKHSDNVDSDESDNQITDYTIFKKVLYFCPTCDNIYVSKQSMQKHTVKCYEVTRIETLENEVITLKQQMEQKLDNKEKQLNKALDIAQVNSKTANASMNMLKYAQTYLNDAEPLEELKGDDILNAIKYKNPKGTETKNEAYVKIAIHKFTHGIFPNFIGDMIIEHYQPKTKSDANVIATDTSRLCFIVMQKITKKDKNKTEQKEWINDKSGKKFTELVLKPIINAVKETLKEFIEFKRQKILSESLICLLGKCI